jgi:serine/threonine-protein kinase HipA
VITQLDLAPSDKLEAFRRMVFNVLGCNRDDHVKNFGFILGDSGQWVLAPAFDVTYAHNPQPGKWTARQQMSILGKREGVTRDDFISIGRQCNIATAPKLKSAVDRVIDSLQQWEIFAKQAGVGAEEMKKINQAIHLQLKP